MVIRILSILFLITFSTGAVAEAVNEKFETQALLNALGYKVGKVDGILGKKSQAALSKFYEDHGINALKGVNDFSINTLREKYFNIYSDTFDIGWNGNFIVPTDVLQKFSQIEKVNLRKICGGDPKRAKQRLSKTLSSTVPMKIAGFNSRMDNIDTVQNAKLLDEFILDFSRLMTSYMSQGKSDDGEIALQALSYWASNNAFLDTVQCTSNGRLNYKKCTEWTEPSGQDLSLIKDHSTVQMHIMHLAYGYNMALKFYKRDDNRHSVIQAWFEKFFARNKAPADVYFGLDHGWYWPKILKTQLEGKSSVKMIDKLLLQLDEDILEDGSIRNRTTRGNKALWYHHDGMKEIMITLELARRHGFEIPKKLDLKVEKAGELFIKAFQDHSYLNKWAKIAHNSVYTPDKQEFSDHLSFPNGNAWLYIYAYRYPESYVTTELLDLLKSEVKKAPAAVDGMVGFGLGCIYASLSDFPNKSDPQDIEKDPLSFEMAEFRVLPREENYQGFQVRVKNLNLGNQTIEGLRFEIMLDFKTGNFESAMPELFRIQVSANKVLLDPASNDVDKCNKITFKKSNGKIEKLRLVVGDGARHNKCIFSSMLPKQSLVVESLISVLPELIEKGFGLNEKQKIFLQATLENA